MSTQEPRDDFDAEIDAHLALEAERLQEEGLTREEARLAARRAFGNVTRARERFYESRHWMWWDHVCQDVRVSLRMLRKSPGFAAVAVLSLTLGVGASTAMFSVINAVLLRPLPFEEPARLVRLQFNQPGLTLTDVPFSVPELQDLRDRAGVFDSVTGIAGGSINLTGASRAERFEFVAATPDYFSMLGATPQLGRLFGPRDFVPGFAPIAVISDGLWRRSYGADPAVIGRTVRLDNDPYTIIGVTRPDFRHPGPTISGYVDIWLACGFSADPAPKPARSTRVMATAVGRLKAGLTIEHAQSQLSAMATQLRAEFPNDYPARAQWTIQIRPLQDSLIGNVRYTLLVLFGAVILIVFVVSLNLANLLLARASSRQSEMAVRIALGASRGRVIRQMLTETMVLAAIGGAAGVLATFGVLDLITRLAPASVPRLDEVRVDRFVSWFALAMSVATGLVFGLAPAFQAAKVSVVSAIREGGRGSGSGRRTTRLRDVLIASELAIAIVLMVGAGLLFRTIHELLREDPGFNPMQVVTAQLWLPVPNDVAADPYLGNGPKTLFDRELLRRLRAVPGVDLAALTSNLPTTTHFDRRNFDQFAIEDRPNESSEDMHAERIRISPDYFAALHAPLVRGRSFSEDDEDGKSPVAIVEEGTARRFWGNSDPVGRRLRFGQDPAQPWLTVIGVVKDIRHNGLDVTDVPHIYVSIYQSGDRTLGIVLRTALPAGALVPEIRKAVQAVDADVPVFGVASMNELLDRSLGARRFSATLVSGFATIALLLAFAGIYGLVSYIVRQRSREIALRMALGASPANVLGLFVQRGVMLATIGIASGVVFALAASASMSSLLYGVRPRDPVVFVTVPLVLLVVAIVASYLPARRATRVDPITSLREA
jgi:putative ABC transport system permease protein